MWAYWVFGVYCIIDAAFCLAVGVGLVKPPVLTKSSCIISTIVFTVIAILLLKIAIAG
jgi:hypothetical protein